MSQPALGAELLSQAFDSALAEPPSADPRKEPISIETTDTSTIAENVSFILDIQLLDLLSFPFFIRLFVMPDTL